MLPYGALWKLDQELHPSSPPRRRTPSLRRGKALFVLLFACVVVSLFLFPYYFAHLKRLRTDLSDPNSKRFQQLQFETQTKQITAKKEKAIRSLLQMNEDANEADVHRLLGEAFTFRERPPSLSLRHPYHSTAYISGIAGDGGGTKWPQYGMGHRGQYTITRGSREIKPAGTGVPLRERHEDENLEVTSSDMCRAALLSTSMAGTAEVHQMESTLYGGGDRETSVIFTVLADYHSAYMWVQTDATGASVGIQERVFSCLVPFYDILTHYRQPPLPEGLYCLCQQSTQHHLVHALNLLLKAGTSNRNVQVCAHVCTLHRVALNGKLYDTPSADWAGAVTAAKEQYEKDKAEISRYYYI